MSVIVRSCGRAETSRNRSRAHVIKHHNTGGHIFKLSRKADVVSQDNHGWLGGEDFQDPSLEPRGAGRAKESSQETTSYTSHTRGTTLVVIVGNQVGEGDQ
jgi:hypothetical protein